MWTVWSRVVERMCANWWKQFSTAIHHETDGPLSLRIKIPLYIKGVFYVQNSVSGEYGEGTRQSLSPYSPLPVRSSGGLFKNGRPGLPVPESFSSSGTPLRPITGWVKGVADEACPHRLLTSSGHEVLLETIQEVDGELHRTVLVGV